MVRQQFGRESHGHSHRGRLLVALDVLIFRCLSLRPDTLLSTEFELIGRHMGVLRTLHGLAPRRRLHDHRQAVVHAPCVSGEQREDPQRCSVGRASFSHVLARCDAQRAENKPLQLGHGTGRLNSSGVRVESTPQFLKSLGLTCPRRLHLSLRSRCRPFFGRVLLPHTALVPQLHPRVAEARAEIPIPHCAVHRGGTGRQGDDPRFQQIRRFSAGQHRSHRQPDPLHHSDHGCAALAEHPPSGHRLLPHARGLPRAHSATEHWCRHLCWHGGHLPTVWHELDQLSQWYCCDCD
mmetsp:Transcript_20211/g.53932  ORF Transcript_20211/g.53932 Transcript_20211/m.53932 type:complete len:293 (-) Transcript_20211:1263-2141(-)